MTEPPKMPDKGYPQDIRDRTKWLTKRQQRKFVVQFEKVKVARIEEDDDRIILVLPDSLAAGETVLMSGVVNGKAATVEVSARGEIKELEIDV